MAKEAMIWWVRAGGGEGRNSLASVLYSVTTNQRDYPSKQASKEGEARRGTVCRDVVLVWEIVDHPSKLFLELF